MPISELSTMQLRRVLSRVWDIAQYRFAGGLRYGLDMPTFRACEPSLAELYIKLQREWKTRNFVS